MRVVGGPAPAGNWSTQTKRIRAEFLGRIRALQAVDEGVASLVNTLRQTGELANTYIIFTSDNGYLLGEHQTYGKNLLDEELRVPMLVRVPGSASRQTSTVPVTLADLAPTIADLADVRPQRRVDGKSFAPALRSADATMPWRDTQLLITGRASSSLRDPGWAWRGVRTARWTFAQAPGSGRLQLYDRDRDPFELVNLGGRASHQGVGPDCAGTRALQDCWRRVPGVVRSRPGALTV